MCVRGGCACLLFQSPFHYRLLQGIEYSSLCCIVGPYCLSILCGSMYLLIPNLSFSPLSPLVTISLFSMSESVSVC